MRRKIYEEMLQWKQNAQGKSALMIDGARRIGKSYIVEEFAKKASGHELFFFSKNSATSAEDRMEIDFLISKPVITNRHNISPVEVKEGVVYLPLYMAGLL